MFDVFSQPFRRRAGWFFAVLFCFFWGILSASGPCGAADSSPYGDVSFNGADFFRKHGAVMLLIDPDNGAILDANQAAVRFYGYAHQELTSLNIQAINLLSPEEVAAEMALAREQRRNHFVFRHRLADDQVRDVEVTSWPVDRQGRPVLFSIVHDITGRVQAEAALLAQQANLENMVAEKTRELRRNHRAFSWAVLAALALLGMVTITLVWGLRRMAEARNALMEKSNLLASLLDSIPDLIFLKDDNGVYIRCNSEFARHVGRPEAGIVGRTDYDIYTRAEADAFRENDRLMLERQGPRHNEEWVSYPDGRRVLLDTLKIPFRRPDGTIVGIIGISRDITERKLAEQALRDKTEELERYFTSSLDLLCIANVRGEFIRLNPEWERVLGYTVSELEGRRFMDFVHPDDVEATLDALGRLGNQEQVHSFENRYLDRHGGYRWIEWRSIPQGELIYAAARDMTDRHNALAALRDSEERMQALIRSIPDLVFVLDENLVFQEYHQPVTDRLLAPPEQFVGKHFESIDFPEPARSEILNALHTTQRTGEPSRTEYWLDLPQGRFRYDLLVTPYSTPPGRKGEQGRGLTVVVRDITERYAMEQALRERSEDLARSNADLEQFAYAVSHDMRQPLRMVSSYLQILEKDLADLLTEETREYMGFAVDGARRMDAMILGLLAYSRVGRKTDPKAWMDSRESLEEALGFLRPAIEESRAEVRIAGDWPRIFASRDEVTRLFQNLVGNAVKYRVPDRPPEVDVTVREQDHDWLFRVRDNGVGVAPGQEDRLFKVFSRLHTRGQYEGTGIGLALCRKIVEHHQGRIWVESEGEGKGSVFCFTLAKVEEAEG